MLSLSAPRHSRALAALAVCAALFILAGCGGERTNSREVSSAAATPTFVPSPPTSTPIQQLPTATVPQAAAPPLVAGAPASVVPEVSTPTPTDDAPSDDAPSETPQPTVEPSTPTAVPAIPTAAPPTPQPTVAPAPIPTRAAPTAVPTRVPTVVPPTPVPPSSGPQLVEIGCTISRRNIKAGEIVTLSAQQSPSGPDVRYRFNHGDGTQDPVAVSQAYYAYPGTYQVTLDWFLNGTLGTVPCGSITVTSAAASPSTSSGGGGYVGLTRDQAIARAGNNGYQFVRLLREDDVSYIVSSGYRGDRLNIQIDNGVVTSATVG